MTPAEAVAYAMRNIDPSEEERSIDRYDVLAGEAIVKRLGHIGWWVVPDRITPLTPPEAATP